VRAHCLRLSDVDGQVRYYADATGNPAPQCFADDWSSVPLRADGTASIPGLTLRLFTPLPPRGGAGKTGSQINARAVSEQSLLLWTTGPVAGGIPALPALSTQNGALLGSVAVGSAQQSPGQSVQFEPVGLSVPLRRGLADHEKPRLLPLD
jgi:hypothetical protein